MLEASLEGIRKDEGKMKKLWIFCTVAMLMLTAGSSALAAATGIQMDGTVYVFYSDEGTFETDGKQFILRENEVVVKEEGKENRVLPLEHTVEAAGDVCAENVPFEMYMQTTELSKAVQGSTEVVDAARFGQYARFGLSYDASTDALYYQGKRVRIFEDSYPLENQSSASIEHVDEQGTIDVKAVRNLSQRVYNQDGSYAPGGVLTGLSVLSDAEFAARDITQWTQSRNNQNAAIAGVELTPQERAAFFAPYASMGLYYNAETDALYYQGKRVRRFLDVRRSNGEPMSSGNFQGEMSSIWDDDGVVDVEIIRDYTRPDENGNGTAVGVAATYVE